MRRASGKKKCHLQTPKKFQQQKRTTILNETQE
jgi:hypothetical protein